MADHDLNMPHDVRFYPDLKGCPPNCPARADDLDGDSGTPQDTA